MNAHRFFFTAENTAGDLIHGMVDVENDLFDGQPFPAKDHLDAIEALIQQKFFCTKALIHEFKPTRANKGTAFYLSPDFTRV